MTNSEYGDYKARIQDIIYHGYKEDLENLYRLILARHGLCQEIYDLDRFYNSRWNMDHILPKQ